VRDLHTLLGMYLCGVRRFGVGLKSGVKILEEAYAIPDGCIDLERFERSNTEDLQQNAEGEY
jgi:hypothetical protein